MTKSLKPLSPEAAALFHLSADEIETIRADCAARALIPYDMLDVHPRAATPSFAKRVRGILADGWRRDQLTTDLSMPIPWHGGGRSYRFHMHAWEPMTYLIPGHEFFDDEDCIRTSLRIADEWLHLFQAPFFSQEIMQGVSQALEPDETMAWYDMAVGQRCYRLAYLTDVAARSPERQDLFDRLFRALVFHQEVLSVDAFWVSHTNHGLYQALGQLAAARRFSFLPGFHLYREKAQGRFATIVKRQFCQSGPHQEHSPGYHRMVFGTITGAVSGGLIDDPELIAVLDRAEEALGWMATPDGSMTTFGDTDHRPSLVSRGALSHLRNKATVAALEEGGDKAAIPAGVKSYPEAGYAFARFRHEGRPPSDDAYLAQIACFHSRVHKHADHLSFVWNDAGVRILVDPGRYDYGEKAVWGDENSVQGFFYSDPKRIYVERTRAHNCVEIDGRDYPRKRVEPFGSALRFAAEVGGMAVTVCDTRHLTRHRRTLILGPGAFLLVLDWLGYKNGPERGFKQWFQLGPEWTAVAEAEGLRARCGDLDLRAKSLVEGSEIGPIHLGETEPMQGWMSPCASELVPSPSFCFQATGATVRFATLFSLSDELEIKSAALNNSLTSGRVRWFDNRETHDVSFRKTDEDGVEAQWRRTP